MSLSRTHAKRSSLYLEEDADLSVLQNRLVASIGYGSQGHAQAQNLRDSGVNVIVGNVEDRYADQARSDGFQVVSIAEAVRRSDILLFLVPDEVQAEIYTADIAPHLQEGQALDFASGYAIHFGIVEPPPHVDVVLCVPACLGSICRERFLQGKGTFGHFGVHQDYSGQARQIVMALAKGMGWLRFGCVECSMEEEVTINLFAESAGLSGILTHLLTAYEVLVEAGFSAESAYSETFYELQFVAEAICRSRLSDASFGSPTSTYFTLSKTPEVINEDVRNRMRDMLGRIRSGELVREWERERAAGSPHFNQLKRRIMEHDIQYVEELFLQRKESSGW